ncbi:MAG: hypothetical protein U0835_12305 [Isosphaeraceae bacterium]
MANSVGMTPRIQALASTAGTAADLNAYYLFGTATKTVDNSPEFPGLSWC